MEIEEKYLLDNNIDNVVVNAARYKENTPENAKHWVYLSDVLKSYSKAQQKEIEELREELKQCHNDKGFYSEQWEKQSKQNTELKKQVEELMETNSALQRFRIADADSAMKREGHLAGKVLELKKQVEELKEEKESDLLEFIDWFGTWQTDKNLSDYGVNDIHEKYIEHLVNEQLDKEHQQNLEDHNNNY